MGPDLYFILALLDSQCRCESLVEVNTELRLHMEKADVVNKALQEDVEKLTVDWSRARDELMRKESQWRMEQEVRETGVVCALWVLFWAALERVNSWTWVETDLSLFQPLLSLPRLTAVPCFSFLPSSALSRLCWQAAEH